MFKQAIELLGFGSSFAYAAAIYGLFHFLDQTASNPAKRAISQWIKAEKYRKWDVHVAIVGAFDRIYTYPLLRPRAFFRSAVISTTIVALVVLEHFLENRYAFSLFSSKQIIDIFPPIWLVVVLSDYISLFFVRRCLDITNVSPIFSLFASVILGSIVILIVTMMAMTVRGVVYASEVRVWDILAHASTLVGAPIFILSNKFLRLSFIVHIWLLLFAVGAIGVRLLVGLFRAVSWGQWFIKRGDQHPLQVVGMVAAVVVFIITAVAHVLS